jgi:RND superfamily putative drug exporter
MSIQRPLARLAHRRRWVLLALFAALFVGAALYGAEAPERLVLGGFRAPDSESARVDEVLEETFGMGDPDVVVAYSRPDGPVLDPRAAETLRPALEALRRRPEVAHLTSPYDRPPTALVSEDGEVAVVTLRLAGGSEVAQEAAYRRIEPLLRVDGLQTRIGGRVPATLQAQRAAKSDVTRGELIALPLVAVLLVIFFRSPVLAVLPLLVGGFAAVGALSCLRLLTHVTDVSVFAMNIVTFLGLGVAVDYSLFLTSRFRDEIDEGHAVEKALERTMVTAGRTIAFSAVAVVASLLGMLVFPLLLLRSVALAGTLVVALALLATLVFLPAGLAAFGTRIEWASFGRRRPRRGGWWQRLAELVMRAPLTVAAVTTAALLLLGAPFLRFEGSVGGAAALPPQSEAREVVELLRSGRFPDNAVTPVEIVAQTSEPVLSAAGLEAVERYADAVARTPGVVSVEAIVGGTTGRTAAQVRGLVRRMGGAGPLEPLVDDRLTVLRVATEPPPDSTAAASLVETLRGLDVPGVRAGIGGEAARTADLQAALERYLPWAAAVIGVTTLVVLFLAFGSVVVPLKAIVMNVLSLTASFGALVWIFQDGRFEELLGYQSTGTVELTIPVVMLAVVFGLAMDYELFLLSRIREAYEDTRDARASVALGLEQTGRIITRAALLLIAVTVGFISADMVLVKELGVGMAIAIAVDATIVRALLVPATMELLGRHNWWAPRWLERLWHRLGLGIEERAPAEP